MSKDTRGGVKAVQQKSKVKLLFIPCGFPYRNTGSERQGLLDRHRRSGRTGGGGQDTEDSSRRMKTKGESKRGRKIKAKLKCKWRSQGKKKKNRKK